MTAIASESTVGATDEAGPSDDLAGPHSGVRLGADCRFANRSDVSDAWHEYRRHLQAYRFGPHVRTGAVVLLSINTLFIIVDWLLFPSEVGYFLPVRLALDAVLICVVLDLASRAPVAGGLAGTLAGGLMLIIVVAGTGGATSDYYVGLILLFLGAPAIVPFSRSQAMIVNGTPLAIVLVHAWVTMRPEDGAEFLLRAFFLSAAAAMGIVTAAVLDDMRFSDFVQRRALEAARDELRALDRAKARFTSNLHHELRTPLTLILSPLEAILDGMLGGVDLRVREHLRLMQRNAVRLLKLISDLLDLARAENHGLEVRRREINPWDVLADVLEAARPLAQRKHIALTAEGIETLPSIYADPDALEKVAMNLIGNALKFTGPGGRVVVSGTLEHDAVHLVVSDTGSGIPPEDLERVFDRFAQLDGSSTRRHEGTGIGLSLVRELVGLHDGIVWAESKGLGLGSQLHVRLPLNHCLPIRAKSQEHGRTRVSETVHVPSVSGAATDEAWRPLIRRGNDYRTAELEHTVRRWSDESEGEPRRHQGEQGASDRPTVLIVDDNEDVRAFLAGILSQQYTVFEARNGSEALHIVRRDLPDLVLTDVMMPDVSGLDVCRLLKANPITSSIPVILVTSRAEKEMKIEGLELGADEYIAKPFDPRELLARVAAMCRLNRLQLDLRDRNAELEVSLAQVDAARREIELYARAVSHDLRSPLVAASEALRVARDAVGERREAMIAVAAANLEVADRMLVGLREMMRAVGPFEEVTSFSARTLVEGVISEIELVSSCERTEIRLVGDPGLVDGQREKLGHVVRNLLSNAIRHSRMRDLPEIVVELKRGSSDWTCVVADNGEGVSTEFQSRIFEPFRKGSGAGAERLGLGLALVEQIVEQHGGRVWVESRHGVGSRFSFTLPLREE